MLLDAYAAIAKRPPLVLIGSRWPETPSSFPAGTVVIEDLAHAAVMAAWRRASLGIVPSLFPDPCPTVVIEAMAAGVPIVASRDGGMPDMVDDGKTGVLVEARDPDALRAAMVKLNRSAATRRAMSGRARTRARQFMAGSVLDRIEAVYRDVVE